MSKKGKKEKESLVTVKVKESTRRRLIQSKAFYELNMGKRLSMDEVITMMIDSLPIAHVKAEFSPGNREKG